LIRDLTSETVAQLKALAEKNKRSLEAEVRLILEDVARRQARREEFWRIAEEISRRSGPQTTDSVDLIREDRER
jgi:hypothetical protein